MRKRWPRLRVKWRRWTLAPFSGSTWGSKRRNRYSLVALGTSVFLLLDLWLGLQIMSPVAARFALCALAPLFLYQVSLAVIWLESETFRVDPRRLVRDVGISIAFSIFVFANFYLHTGIVATYDKGVVVTNWDNLYFSIVTFTTLGFGDFRPSDAARLMAGMQALLGTVHVGLIVGAVYVAVKGRD